MTSALSGVGLRGVIVDYGGVISRRPSPSSLAVLRSLCELGEDGFASAWLRHRDGYDSGQLSVSEYWTCVLGREPEQVVLEQIIAADIACWQETDPCMTDWMNGLRAAGFLVGVLSNMPREHWLAFAERHRWPPLCDTITLSWQHGATKPATGLFNCCLADLGLRPDEALFVDDMPANIAAAAELGLHTLLYSGPAELREQLRLRYGEALPLPVADGGGTSEPCEHLFSRRDELS